MKTLQKVKTIHLSAVNVKCSLGQILLTCLYLSLLEDSGELLVAPLFLRVVLHGAAVGLHLLVQPAAVDEDRLAGLGVPASLAKHLLQLLDGVAALPLPDAVFLHSAVAAPQRLVGHKVAT